MPEGKTDKLILTRLANAKTIIDFSAKSENILLLSPFCPPCLKDSNKLSHLSTHKYSIKFRPQCPLRRGLYI